jgi:3-oxoacyl-(acyl-carrier-protein) synthase
MTSNSNGRRVAVTGMGFITPIGNDLETVWSNMIEGVSGIGRITHFDTTIFDCKIAGEVKGFNPEEYMDRKTARHIGRYCQFALAASKQALAQSGLEPSEMDPDDVGVIVSSGIGGMEEIENGARAEADQPVHGPDDDRGHGGRDRRDSPACGRAQLRHRERLRLRLPRYR